MKCKNCQLDFLPRRKNQQYCQESCGNSFRSQTWRNSGKEKIARLTPKYKYHIHKTNAKMRGVEFKLSFDEWWSIWEPHWVENQLGKLCMCRTNDKGAYEIGNVRIDTWANNLRERCGLELLT